MKRTLLILQCCKKKGNTELYPDNDFDLAKRIPKTTKILNDAIAKFSQEGVIELSSRPITSLSRYNGHFYSTPRLRSRVVKGILQGPYQVLIMSAAYGFVHPFQRIHIYEQRMTGNITRYWLSVGLHRVLEEFIETGRFKKVYGFFSKSADYRKIFDKVRWSSLRGLEEAGYFYLKGARGASKILRTSAMLLMKFLDEDFKEKPMSFKGIESVFSRTV